MSAIRRIVTVCLCSLALAACQEDVPSESESGIPDILAGQRAACAKQGGEFGQAPNGVTFVCYRTLPDANRTCTTSRDCEGLCLARSRTCSPVEPMFGCHEVISSSGLRQTLCTE
jgi:hypothetical protein